DPVEYVEECQDAELVHGGVEPGLLVVVGAGVDAGVGGQRGVGGQPVPGQPGGAGLLAPQPDPGVVPLGLLTALLRPGRVDVGGRGGGQLADLGGGQVGLAGGLAVQPGQDQRLGAGGLGVVEDGQFVGDDGGFEGVEAALGQPGVDAGQPGLQRDGQGDQL